MSITRQPVKSSRLFLGHLHEVAVSMLAGHFGVQPDKFKLVKPDKILLETCRKRNAEKRFFFDMLPYSRELKDKYDFFVFKSYEEGYHQLMVELAELTIEAIDLIMPATDDIENIYITGGFSKNLLFLRLISDSYPSKNVYTSEIANATALGSALVIYNRLNPRIKPVLNLGLSQC
jgi:hypothetical protein